MRRGLALDRRSFRPVVAAAALGLLALSSSAGAVPPGGAVRLKVVASNLNNPHKLFVEADGAIDLVEAGTGGRDKCLGTGAAKVCIGLTGSISRIASGTQTRVVT